MEWSLTYGTPPKTLSLYLPQALVPHTPYHGLIEEKPFTVRWHPGLACFFWQTSDGLEIPLPIKTFQSLTQEDGTLRVVADYLGAKPIGVTLEAVPSFFLKLGPTKDRVQTFVPLVKSPLTGVVLGIHAKPGEQVKKGDLVATIEAMKMENKVLSPSDGVVEDICTASGRTVQVQEVLLRLAPLLEPQLQS